MQRLPDDGSVPASRADLALLRTWTDGEFQSVRQDIAGVRAWAEGEFNLVRQEIAGMRVWAEGEFKSLRIWAEGEFKTVRQEMQTIKQEILSTMNRRFAAMTLALVVTIVASERYL